MKKFSFPKVSRIAGASLLSVAAASPLVAAEVSWNVETGDLLDPLNWVGEIAPTTGDTAVISNGGTATLSEESVTFGQIWVGQNGQGTATGSFVQTGGALTLTGGGVVGRQGNAVGSWTMTGGSLTTGEFRVGGGGSSGTTPAGSVGVMTVANVESVVNSSGYVGIGSTGNGTLTLSDSATWFHNGGAVFLVGGDNNNNPLGQVGGTGILNVRSGASLLFNGTANLGIGRNTNTTVTTGNGTVNLEGGSITMGSGTVNLGSTQGGGQLGGTGTLNVRSGTLTSVNGIKLNEGTGTVNFDGGVSIIGGIIKTMGNGVGTVNFNGGIVQAATTTADFFSYSGTSGTGVLNLNIRSGGMKFDTDGYSVIITQGMSGVGGLTKLGDGDLTLSGVNLYSGGTVVSGGVLIVAEGGTTGSGAIIVQNGGALDFDYDFTLTTAGLVLEAGSTFTLDQNLAFAGVTIGGDVLAEGVYDYTTLKASYGSIFADGGSGQITVLAVPEPSTYALLAIGGVAGLVLGFRRKMRA